jgi:hypothetical protein
MLTPAGQSFLALELEIYGRIPIMLDNVITITKSYNAQALEIEQCLPAVTSSHGGALRGMEFLYSLRAD